MKAVSFLCQFLHSYGQFVLVFVPLPGNVVDGEVGEGRILIPVFRNAFSLREAPPLVVRPLRL